MQLDGYQADYPICETQARRPNGSLNSLAKLLRFDGLLWQNAGIENHFGKKPNRIHFCGRASSFSLRRFASDCARKLK